MHTTKLQLINGYFNNKNKRKKNKGKEKWEKHTLKYIYIHLAVLLSYSKAHRMLVGKI